MAMQGHYSSGRYNAVDPCSAVDWDHPRNKGLVGWWFTAPGVPAAGSRLLDLSGRNHLTLANTALGDPTWSPTGRGDVSLNFTSSQAVGLPSTITTNQLTVGCWVNPNALTRGDLITCWNFGGDSASQFDLLYGLTSGLPQLFVSGGVAQTSGAGSTAMVVGKWNRVIGTYNGSVASIYLNGVLQAAATLGITMNSAALSPIRLAINSSGSGQVAGRLADSFISNRAWTAAEIASDYRASIQGYRTPDSPLRWVSARVWSIPSSVSPRYLNLLGVGS